MYHPRIAIPILHESRMPHVLLATTFAGVQATTLAWIQCYQFLLTWISVMLDFYFFCSQIFKTYARSVVDFFWFLQETSVFLYEYSFTSGPVRVVWSGWICLIYFLPYKRTLPPRAHRRIGPRFHCRLLRLVAAFNRSLRWMIQWGAITISVISGGGMGRRWREPLSLVPLRRLTTGECARLVVGGLAAPAFLAILGCALSFILDDRCVFAFR